MLQKAVKNQSFRIGFYMKSKLNQNKDRSLSKNVFDVRVSRSQSIKMYNQIIDKMT